MANLGLFTSPMDFPSQIQPGKHRAVFFNAAQLFLELDGHAVEQMTPRSVITLLAAEMKQFAGNHPRIAAYAAMLGSAIPQAVAKTLWEIFKLSGYSVKETALFLRHVGGMIITTPVGAILAAELIILTARWIEIVQKHKCSRNGGVIIQVMFPAVQVASQVMPRGGYTGERIERAREVLQNVGQNVGQHIQQGLQNVEQGLQNAGRFIQQVRPRPLQLFRRRR